MNILSVYFSFSWVNLCLENFLCIFLTLSMPHTYTSVYRNTVLIYHSIFNTHRGVFLCYTFLGGVSINLVTGCPNCKGDMPCLWTFGWFCNCILRSWQTFAGFWSESVFAHSSYQLVHNTFEATTVTSLLNNWIWRANRLDRQQSVGCGQVVAASICCLSGE